MSAPGMEIRINKEFLLDKQMAGKDLKKVVGDLILERLSEEEGSFKEGDQGAFVLHSDAPLVVLIEHEPQAPDPSELPALPPGPY